MPRALKVCSNPGCPELTTRGGRCEDCRREADQRRGTAAQRGYGHAHRTRFVKGVKTKHPTCHCPPDHPTHEGRACTQWTEHADHWPKNKKQLIAEGQDDNDPRHGRGLCGPCHSYRTSQAQPGGWHHP